MDGIPAIYLGRIVKKEGFRAFIYGPNGSQKLVESWDAFERHMESGVWFSSKKDAASRVPVALVEEEVIINLEPDRKDVKSKTKASSKKARK